jgi:ABC-2 type transport system permease protein
MFARTCAVKEMEFRGNFWLNVFTNAIWVGAYLVFAKIIYANTDAVADWRQGEAIVLLGTYALVSGLVGVLFSRNLAELPNQIRLGLFDFTLLKPVNSQFFVSLRYLNFSGIGDVGSSLILIAYGIRLEGMQITLGIVAQYIVLVTCGLMIYYSIFLLLMTTAFWFIKVENLWTLVESTSQVARVPMNIYGPLAMRFFTFVLPLVFLAHLPAEAMRGAADLWQLGLGIGMALFFLFASNRFWRFATRFYSSASS